MNSRTRALLTLMLATIIIAALALSGCGGGQTDPVEQPQGETTEQAPPETTEEAGLYTPEYKPNGEEVAVFKTSKGDITVKLYGTDAPIHVGNFVELVRKGFYDQTKFHRYIEGFVVQGGDPETKEADAEFVAAEGAKPDGAGSFGTGGPGYFIKGEFDPEKNPNKHVEGALGMARAQSPDSAGSQFYFTLAETPNLDGGYTVFGQVTKGLDVMKQLRAGDVIEKIELSGTTE